MPSKNFQHFRPSPFQVAAAILIAGFVTSAGMMLAGQPLGFVVAAGFIAAAFVAIGLEARERAAQAARIEDALVRMARGVEQVGAHLAAVEDRLNGAERWIAHEAREDVAQSAAEIEMLGTLVKELAVTVAHHDAELGGPVQREQEQAQAAREPQRAINSATPDHEVNLVLAAIDRSIAEASVDLLMQPIVSLPQRRVKFYEATPQVRAADGQVFGPAQIMPVADASGRRVAFDLAMVKRLFGVTRRLLARSRDLMVFVRVDLATARDSEALVSLMQGNQDMAGHVVLSLSQAGVRAIGPAGFIHLRRLGDLGFAFAVTEVADLRLDGRNLFDSGVRYVKIPASLILADGARAPSEIHPGDLARQLSRNGIQLIVENIDLEKTVPEVLDLDVRFGQGNAFSPPRAIRPEVLQAREAVEPTSPAANDGPTAVSTPSPQRMPYRSVLKRAQ
ncbi:MAG: EAL domain-containing protein [Beijerinckiaceae bacterium]